MVPTLSFDILNGDAESDPVNAVSSSTANSSGPSLSASSFHPASLESPSLGSSSSVVSHSFPIVASSSPLEDSGELVSPTRSPSSSSPSLSSSSSSNTSSQTSPSQSRASTVSPTRSPGNDSNALQDTTPAPTPAPEKPPAMPSSGSSESVSPSSVKSTPTRDAPVAPSSSGSSGVSKPSASQPSSTPVQASDKPASSQSKSSDPSTPSAAQSSGSHVSVDQETVKSQPTPSPSKETAGTSLGGVSLHSLHTSSSADGGVASSSVTGLPDLGSSPVVTCGAVGISTPVCLSQQLSLAPPVPQAEISASAVPPPLASPFPLSTLLTLQVSVHHQDDVRSSPSVSTITDHPETTLSSPVLFSVTNALGQVTLSEPPIFTSISGSTLDNGVHVSVTHIIANPTGVWNVNDTSAARKTGFFNNTGAVAGVFLVVGIVVATIIAVVSYFICRKRRRQRIRHSISRPLPLPDNPFEDPRDSPPPTEMRFADRELARNLIGSGVGVIRTQNRNFLDDEFKPPSPPTMIYSTSRHEMPSMTNNTPAGTLAGVGAWGQDIKAPYNGPFSDYISEKHTHRHRPSLTGGVGLMVHTDQVRDVPSGPPIKPQIIPTSPPSPPSAQSSPSIYPSSIPPAPAELAAEDGRQPTSEIPPISIEPPLLIHRQLSSKSDAPQVPPRNPLRNSQRRPTRHPAPLLTPQNSTNTETSYEPLTPPASSESDLSSSTSSGSDKVSQGLADVNAFPSRATGVKTASGLPPPPGITPRDNFYTRRKNTGQLRSSSSVEWKR